MKFVPNILSAIRCVMALFLFVEPSLLTLPYVLIGGFTDFADGFIARRYQIKSRLGTWLDPLGDKLAAVAVVYNLYLLSELTLIQIACLFSRDIALVVFGLELLVIGQYRTWTVQSFLFGKWATTLQFLILVLIIGNVPIPAISYWIMGSFGPLCLLELNFLLRRQKSYN